MKFKKIVHGSLGIAASVIMSQSAHAQITLANFGFNLPQSPTNNIFVNGIGGSITFSMSNYYVAGVVTPAGPLVQNPAGNAVHSSGSLAGKYIQIYMYGWNLLNMDPDYLQLSFQASVPTGGPNNMAVSTSTDGTHFMNATNITLNTGDAAGVFEQYTSSIYPLSGASNFYIRLTPQGATTNGFAIDNIQVAGFENKWTSMTTRYRHSAGITQDGVLWLWGKNDFGQVGESFNTLQDAPFANADWNKWTAAACGYWHTMAIANNNGLCGTLYGFGKNDDGQLGDGTYNNTNGTTPTQVAGSHCWASVSCGYRHTIAIDQNGHLWGWGYNGVGSLGNPVVSTHTNTPVQEPTNSQWKNVSCGSYHTAAIKSDGTLWTWGYNLSGQLGNGNNTNQFSPVQVFPGTTWKMVACGYYHTLAIKSDGTLWAWGYNYYGNLGDGNPGTNSNVPEQIGSATDWALVSGGWIYSFGVKSNGNVYGWGDNSGHELGDGTTNNYSVPTLINSQNYSSMASGDYVTLALQSGVSGYCFAGEGSDVYGEAGTGFAPTSLGATGGYWFCAPTFAAWNIAGRPGTALGLKQNIYQNVSEVTIFPNPSDGVYNILLPKLNKGGKLEVYDVSGKKIVSELLNSDSPKQINLSDYPEGVYLTKIFLDDKVITKKIVKQ